MAKRLYGSLQNRLEENRQFCETIEVGTGVTEYSYSDRHAYEVVAVKDQKHVTIREYDHKFCGEAYTNDWELISNPENPEINLVKRGDYWYTASTLTAEELKPMLSEDGRIHLNNENFDRGMWMAQNFDFDKVLEKGKQTVYRRMNVSFGVADYYYDYEF
ncbi:MAG: hypothetical protein KBS75_09200 [Bacteroidales bacterium]|nr:hypothetical protein [Candidatus Equimonas faecalis]